MRRPTEQFTPWTDNLTDHLTDNLTDNLTDHLTDHLTDRLTDHSHFMTYVFQSGYIYSRSV